MVLEGIILTTVYAVLNHAIYPLPRATIYNILCNLNVLILRWFSSNFLFQKNKYFVIQRKSVSLSIDSANEQCWVYGCSCSPSHQRFVSSLHSSLLCTEQGIYLYSHCSWYVAMGHKSFMKILCSLMLENIVENNVSELVNRVFFVVQN